MKRVLEFLIVVFAIAAMVPSTVSAAGLLLSIADLHETSPGVDSFEVLLSNSEQPGGTSFDVSVFSFEIAAPAGSSMMFTDASILTTAAPYIFDGIGQAAIDPTFTLAVDPGSLPAPSLIGADAQFVGSGPLSTDYFAAIGPEVTVSLGLVSFTADRNEPPAGLLPSLILGPGTVLADIAGSSIPFALQNAAVPEPSSLVMLALGSLGLIGLASRLPHSVTDGVGR